MSFRSRFMRNAPLDLTQPAGHPAIHFKLEVGAINDPLEGEADRMADLVVGMPNPRSEQAGVDHVRAPTRSLPLLDSYVQRMCTSCEEESDQLRRRAEPAAAARGGEVLSGTVAKLRQLPTRPLPSPVRDYFEPRFGCHFGNVRLATGDQTESMAAQLGARAFNVGDTIAFAAGAFTPGTNSGRRLIAHELAHVVQHADATANPNSTVLRRAPPKEQDWCGSEGSAWVPDSPFGIPLAPACEAHDEDYGSGVPKSDADREFRQRIMQICEDDNRGVLCNAVAWIYWGAVAGTPQGVNAYDRSNEGPGWWQRALEVAEMALSGGI